MHEQLQSTLKEIALRLNEAKICWALGGSALLDCFEMNVEVHDLDIMVEANDFDKAIQSLCQIGQTKIKEDDVNFRTEYFKSFMINACAVDVMSGLCVKWNDRWFEFKFTRAHIGLSKMIEDVRVPLMTIEDWYVFYHWLNRPNKISEIERYAKAKGIALIKHPLESWLTCE